MLRDLLSSRLIQGDLAFFVLVVGGSLLYSGHVRRTTEKEMARHARFLQSLEKPNETRPAETESVPTENETPGLVNMPEENTDTPMPDETEALPNEDDDFTDAFLPDDFISEEAFAEEVPVSPYGFGPYPEVPAEMPADTFPSPTANHELIARVRIKLIDEGINARGVNMENGWAYPVIPGIAYVKWKEYERPDGTVRYISDMIAHPSDGFRIAAIREKKGRAFTEAEIPSDIKLMSFEEGAIDPYSWIYHENECLQWRTLMHTRYKRKHTSIYRDVFFFLFFLTATALWYFGHHRSAEQEQHTQIRLPERTSPPVTKTPRFIIDIENAPPLSSEATRLLAQLKKEARTYTSQLTDGEINFSVTLSKKSPTEAPHFFVALWHSALDTLMPPKETKIEKPPKYDVLGEWNITYRFEGDTEFFDVKAEKKREMNRTHIVTRMPDGSLRTNIWRKTHHQFMRKRQQELYIQDGAVWKPFEEWRLSLSASQSIDFDPRFNPQWWRFGHDAAFDTFIRCHKITAVKTVDIDGSSQVYLQLHNTKQIKTTHRAKTMELYMSPQESGHPNRILKSTRTAAHFPVYEEGAFNRPKPIP